MIYKAIKIETIEHTTADLPAEQLPPFRHFSKENGNLIRCYYTAAATNKLVNFWKLLLVF